MDSQALEQSMLRKLLRRFRGFFSVGMLTFTLDLLIVFILYQLLSMPLAYALITGFIIGITLNYLLNYHYVYAGTQRHIIHGFFIFITLAIISIIIITQSTVFLVDVGVNAYVARITVGAMLGVTSFFLNTFFNFKLV